MRAVLLGATGLVGSRLLRLLIEDSRFSEIHLLSRRICEAQSKKIRQHVIDFDDPKSWPSVSADVLFSAFGTTRKQAGSLEAQYKIDFTYQWQVAEWAVKQPIARYVLISSLGVDPRSQFFYPRIRGELEEAVKNLPFDAITILRPGLLVGDRERERPLEAWIGKIALETFGRMPGLRKYVVRAETVATAMVHAACSPERGVHVVDGIY